MKYLFVLGMNPALSVAELEHYFSAREETFKITEKLPTSIIAEVFSPSNSLHRANARESPAAEIRNLGGTVKIAEVLGEYDSLEDVAAPEVSGLFSLSVSGFQNNVSVQRKVAMKIKRSNLGSKFFRGKKPQISAVEILKKNLVGKDFVLQKFENKVIFAKTVAVYDPFDFKKRDTGRPRQRPLYSMPIRVAKIMLNLAGVTSGKRVLDPFCGYGIILQEACSLGAEAHGTDIDNESAEAARQNMEWFCSEYNIEPRSKVTQADVMKIGDVYQDEFFDAIITEPDLGPPLRIAKRDEAERIISGLKDFYRKVFQYIFPVVKTGGSIVIVMPKIKYESRQFAYVDVKNILPPGLHISESFEVRRSGQTTIRNIYVLKKV